MHKSLLAVLAVGVLVLACHPVTEELPIRPNPVFSVPPIVVVPVPVPTAPPTPSNPTPPQNPTPPGNPTPPQNPTPPPSNPTPPGGGDVPDNTNPVAKLTAKLYFAECSGQIVDPSEMRVGCRCHLDVTPTDSSNKHTRVRGELNWTFTNQGIFSLGGTMPFNPTLLGTARGRVDAYAQADGVTSNTVSCEFR
jgi:hypothetical protein